jgi:hypothetical protein
MGIFRCSEEVIKLVIIRIKFLDKSSRSNSRSTTERDNALEHHVLGS